MTIVNVSWPKRFTLCHQYGLICSATNTTVWSMNSHDSRATLNLSAVSLSSACLQLQVYVKNVGNCGRISDPLIDTTTHFGVLLDFKTSPYYVFFTGVSLQRLMTFSVGNNLAQKCIPPQIKLNKIVSSESTSLPPVRVMLDREGDSSMYT